MNNWCWRPPPTPNRPKLMDNGDTDKWTIGAGDPPPHPELAGYDVNYVVISMSMAAV